MLVAPVREMLLVPGATYYFKMEQLQKTSGGSGVAVGQKIILIVAKEKEKYEELTEESFYPIGIAGTITEINQQGYAAVRTQYRVNLDTIVVNRDHSIHLTISRRREIEDLDSAVEKEKLKNLIQEIRAFASGYDWKDMAEQYLSQVDSISTAVAGLSPWINTSNEECYAILAEDSVAKCHSANYLEAFLSVYLETNSGSNSVMGILNYCCPAK